MRDDTAYASIDKSAEFEIEPIKNSRFIAVATPVSDSKAAMDFITQMKSCFPDARHWCWAYRLRQQQQTRFNDDGEPAGSAGKPILATIVGRELFDTLIVVIRYFGGVKLGVGGLVRAYSKAANAVLAESEIITITPTVTVVLHYPYEVTGQVAAALHKLALSTENNHYGDCVQAEIRLPADALKPALQVLTDYTGGKLQYATSR